METRIKVIVRLEAANLPAHAVVREMHLSALRRRIAPVICKYFEILYTQVYEQCKVAASQDENESKPLVVNKATLLPEIQKRLISGDYFEKSVRCRLASDLIASSADPGGVEFIECVFSVFHSTLHLLAAADGRIGEANFGRKLNGTETQANYFQTPNGKEKPQHSKKNASVRIEERENITVELSSTLAPENAQDVKTGAEQATLTSSENSETKSGTNCNNSCASQSVSKRRNLALVSTSSKGSVECAKMPQFCVLGCTVGALVSEIYSAAARRLFNNPFLLLQDVGAQLFVERHAKCLLEIEQAVDQCVYDSALIMLRRLREKTMFATLENFPSQLNCMKKFSSAAAVKSESSVGPAPAEQNRENSDRSSASLASAMTLCKSERANRKACFNSQTASNHSNESSPALPLIVTPSPFGGAGSRKSSITVVAAPFAENCNSKPALKSEPSHAKTSLQKKLRNSSRSESHPIMHIPLSNSMAKNFNCASSEKADSSAGE